MTTRGRDDGGDHMDCDFHAAQQEVSTELSSGALIWQVLMAEARRQSSAPYCYRNSTGTWLAGSQMGRGCKLEEPHWGCACISVFISSLYVSCVKFKNSIRSQVDLRISAEASLFNGSISQARVYRRERERERNRYFIIPPRGNYQL